MMIAPLVWIIVFLHREFITCTTGGLNLVPRPLPPEKCLGTRLRRSLSTLSKAFLRSTKATNVGNLFYFLAPITLQMTRMVQTGTVRSKTILLI